MTNDMTKGSPLKLIIQFMIPMCLGNIFQQFYNIADSIIAGQFLGVDALAAIGSTGSLIFLVTGWLNGLTSGFSVWVAQWFGAGKIDRMRHFIAMSVYICVGFVVVMTGGLLIANEPILRMMNAPENLMADISGYMAIIYAGLAVTCAYNALAAVLRALGDSKSPLYFLIISAILNVVLDIVFIVVFHMGVEGCGYATVIAQGISALLCLVYIIKKFPVLRLKRGFQFLFPYNKETFGAGNPHGAAVFYYSYWNNYCTGCNQCLRCCLYGGIFSSREDTEYYLYRVCGFWRYHCHLCGSEPGSRKNGSCETGCSPDTDYDSGVQRSADVCDSFLWKIYDFHLY